MSVMLLTKHHFEFLSLKGDCTGSSESTLVKMPHCWKSHVPPQITNPHGIQYELPFKGPGAFKIACRIILFPYTETLPGFLGTGATGYLFQGNRGTKVKF